MADEKLDIEIAAPSFLPVADPIPLLFNPGVIGKRVVKIPTTRKGQGSSNGLIQRGRPVQTERRQTLPVEPGKNSTQAPTGVESIVQRRRSVLRYSNADLDFATADPQVLLDILPELSADFSTALNYYTRLGNTGLKVSCKVPQKDALKGSVEDPEATKYLNDILKNCNVNVDSQIPSATGSLSMLADAMFHQVLTRGAIAVEVVPTMDKRDTTEVVTFDPSTVQFRRDPIRRGKYFMFQYQHNMPLGIYPLNPNLITYRAINDDLYGRALFAPALRVLPYWMRYWSDLQIFLHNAAFGFIDASMDTEKMEIIWKSVTPIVKKQFDNDFLKWATSTLADVMDDYNNGGERDPDSIMGHLDILNLTSLGTASSSFPILEARTALKREIYTALKIPPALMGEDIPFGSEKFAALQTEAFVSTIQMIRDAVVSVLNRVAEIIFRIKGWDKPITTEFTFAPVKVDDLLTAEQARQLRILNELKLRDENIQSQNAVSEVLVGRPALGPNPMSPDSDPDGPSAPNEEVLLGRLQAKLGTTDSNGTGKSDTGAASGPSFGGAKKTRDTNPGSDKKL